MGFGEQVNASGFDPDMEGAVPSTSAIWGYDGRSTWFKPEVDYHGQEFESPYLHHEKIISLKFEKFSDW